jgi:hypothetical protein
MAALVCFGTRGVSDVNLAEKIDLGLLQIASQPQESQAMC